jgi:hypothetical protein
MQIRTSLKKIQKYTSESTERTTTVTVFLAELITTQGYNKKNSP